jgi:hypothetical protein
MTQEQICCGKTGYLLCGFDMKYLALQGSDAQNQTKKKIRPGSDLFKNKKEESD